MPSTEEQCTPIKEGNDCYVMVGKLNAYMSPLSTVDEKTFRCDIFTVLKYIIDNVDFSDVDRLEAIEFLGSDEEYCWQQIYSDSFRTMHEADGTGLSPGVIATIAVASVATLLITFKVARHKKEDKDGNYTNVMVETDSVTMADEVIFIGDISALSKEANDDAIEVNENFLRHNEQLSTIKEDISYTSDDLESM